MAQVRAANPIVLVTLMSCWGGGSVSAMGSSIADGPPRPSNSATHALPSRRDGKRIAVEQLRSDRLCDRTPAGGDLVQIKVPQTVFEQQLGMSVLDLLSGGDVVEVDHRTVEAHQGRDEYVLHAPLCRNRRVSEVFCGFGSVPLDMPLARRKVRPEVREHLAQARLGKLGEVEGAKAALDVVEAVVESVQLVRVKPSGSR
jgi:hypothetical protein